MRPLGVALCRHEDLWGRSLYTQRTHPDWSSSPARERTQKLHSQLGTRRLVSVPTLTDSFVERSERRSEKGRWRRRAFGSKKTVLSVSPGAKGWENLSYVHPQPRPEDVGISLVPTVSTCLFRSRRTGNFSYEYL